ncbi:MAG: aldehyde dehydrogenase family protein [Planctomycetes bacterium]|nr:aldehyde dehydrogenase family protein [Planctomycetota bacterium]
MTTRGTNWIEGAEVPARRGAWYEPAAEGGGPAGVRRPRSTVEDLDLALGAAAGAERAWRAQGRAARCALLEHAAARLLDTPDPGDAARRALGFEGPELAEHLAGLEQALADGLGTAPALARGPLGAREGACLLAPAWAATWLAPARAAWFALAAGRPVILAPDGRLPSIGDAFREALRDLPPGVFGVLHDDGRTLVRAAEAHARLPTLVASAERLDDAAERAAHVVVAPARRATLVVDPGADLEAQAQRAVRDAIGRARALSGSRSGQVGRVVVPERAFSRVEELVLGHLETLPDAARPLCIARAAQDQALDDALALGLDEGATAILAGRDAQVAPFPLLFTNVEPGMRVAQLARPLGLVALLRARDLRAAHALAARLDREVRS